MMLTEAVVATVVNDVNFNSPGHHSSQDGSFIQDEADMHLILDFDNSRNMTMDPLCRSPYRPSSVLTSSWINKRQNKWATDFDANIAELDFDNVATRDILAIGAATEDSYYKDEDMKDWNQNRLRESIRRSLMQGSLDLSLSRSGSLFSSTGLPEPESKEIDGSTEEMLAANLPAFISTDSLDLSSLVIDPEHIKNVCATKKGDYVLTYEPGSMMVESGLAESVQKGSYQDAHLSNVREEALEKLEQMKKSVVELTTWGRIRRSYEISFNDTAEAEGRSCSLPNLSAHQLAACLSGAGERMLSACSHAMPIYNLAQSMSESSHYRSFSADEDSNSAERLSLLKVYRNKLSVMGGANLVIPSETAKMNDSSGYVTGGNGTSPEVDSEIPGKRDRKSKNPEDAPELQQMARASEDNQSPDFTPQQVHVHDHDYAEFFVNGRYIDVNHNEIGFVPASTQGLQRTTSSVQETPDIPRNQRAQFALNNSTVNSNAGETQNRWATLTSPRLTKIAPAKPPRTFATLLETSKSINNDNYDSETAENKAISPVSPRQDLAMGKLRSSGTQVPMYVVDQSVQTTCWDAGKLITTVVTTSVRHTNDSKPIYTGKLGAFTASTMSGSISGMKVEGDLPDMSFLRMPFDVPSLFPACAPFPVAFLEGGAANLADLVVKKTDEEKGGPSLLHQHAISAQQLLRPNGANQATISGLNSKLGDFIKFPFPSSSSFADKFLLGCQLPGTEGLPSPPAKRLLSDTSLTTLEAQGDQTELSGGVTRDRDSGLGSSGPSHIQDWESLAALLPKDVVQACSFFKANSQLFLSRSQQVTPRFGGSGNSIDKPSCGGRNSKRIRGRCGRNRPVSEPGYQRHHALLRKIESIREEDYEDGHYADGCRYDREQTTSAASLGCFHQPCNCPMFEQQEARCRQCRSCPSERYNHYYHHHHHHYHHCCHKRCASTEQRRSSNLQKWHDCRISCRHCGVGSESESEESEVEVWQHGKDMRRRFSEGSSTEEEEECYGDSYFLSGAVTSEYHLRKERDRAEEPRRFHSLQNVRDYQRQRGSFLGEETAMRPRTVSDYGHGQCSKACATCFRVRSPTSTRPPVWAIRAEEKTREVFCDCQTSDILEEMEADKRRRYGGKTLVNFFSGFPSSELADEEVALQKTALYKCKKAMVKDVVDACDIVVSVYSGARKSTSFKVESLRMAVGDVVKNSLCPAVEKILADGLMEQYTIWNVIQASATLGPATRSIHELVTDLNITASINSGEHSLQFESFLNGLLNLRSLDCWLSYLVLKDKVLSDHYHDAAFLRRAATAYRSLFTQVLIGIQPLSLLHFPQLSNVESAAKKISAGFNLEMPKKAPRSSSVPAVTTRVSIQPELNVDFRTPENSTPNTPSKQRKRTEYTLLPTRLPSDSRVPKSSSVPSRLCSPGSAPKSRSVDSGLLKLAGNAGRSPSKIPILMKASPSFPGATKGEKGGSELEREFPSGSVMSISEQESDAEEMGGNRKRMVSVLEDSQGDQTRGFLPCKAGEKLELIQNCVVPGQQLLKCRKRITGGYKEGFVQRRKISLFT